MKPIWKFRLLALPIVLFVGMFSIASLTAELLRRYQPPSKPPPASDTASAAALAATIAPFREDLKADAAAAQAAEAMSSNGLGAAASNEAARSAVKAALKIGPHDARMWLTLSLLQARANLGDALVAESLKMSYLTGPTQAGLIPVRLDLVSRINSLSDPDLQELAASDVRAILTRFANLRPLLVKAYASGSTAGRKFLEDSAKAVDPSFAGKLHDAR